jgi:hypothetical protein
VEESPPILGREERVLMGTAGDKVAVASRIPNGLICRVAGKPFVVEEPVPNMPGVTFKHERRAEFGRFEVKGSAVPNDGPASRPSVQPEFVITEDLPRDLVEEWLKQNADQPFVKSGAFKMFNTGDQARAYAREHDRGKGVVLTGFEPLDSVAPEKDVRIPRMSGAANIQPGER